MLNANKQSKNVKHNNSTRPIVKSLALPEILHSDSGDHYRWTEQLKEHVSFSGYLKGQGHVLTKSGAGHLARCPFHKDWGFTFVVSDDVGECSVCKWKGDIIEFVMQHHHLGLADSFRHLTNKAWTCRKDAPICIFNAAQVQDFPRVLICQSEEDAILLLRGKYDIQNRCAVIAVDSPLGASEQLERLLKGKDVRLLMGPDDEFTGHYLDVVEECAKSVTLHR